MIWLAVVGILTNQNLCQWCHWMWWGILTNQTLDVSLGLLGSPWVVSTGLHGWSPWVSMGGLCGSPWVVWWQGARQMTDWFGGRGQGKWMTNVVSAGGLHRWSSWVYACALVAGDKANQWLTGLVTGGKANDWLMWSLHLVSTGLRGSAWVSSGGLCGWSPWVSVGGLVAGGKANDWLVWWQGARQMTN